MLAEALYQSAPSWMRFVMLNAYGWRIGRHRYGQPYERALAASLARERAPRDEIRRYQDERLVAVVAHAYVHSPYYRRLLDERGIRPCDVLGADDLPRLPLLTKETIRARGAELLTAPKPLAGWRHGHTSGTTGSPLSLWYDRNTCVINNAVDGRQKAWGGMRPGDWIGLLLGRVIVPPTQRRPPYWQANHAQRQVWFSTFHMTEENLERYVAEIRARGLRFLEGYPSTLYILARYLVQRGLTLPMRAVFSSSETLLDLQRETIERAFDCCLFDFYGLAERTIFAAECEAHEGKHLAEEYGITEVVDDEGNPVPDGETGYLVGTSLHNTALPMLRYRTGDISAIRREPCACGRTLLRIQNVTTKAEDIVVTPDGRMISPSILTHPFKPFDQILKSQLIQERREHLLVKIVPSAEFTPAHQAQLLAGLRQRLGAGMEIEIRVVEDIPRERSGKYRWVISRVEHPCAVSWEPAGR